MSSDIIERLENASYENAPSRCFEAAREIKQLRALLQGPSAPLQCLRCGTVDAFGPVSPEKK